MPLCTEAFESRGVTSKAFYVMWGGCAEPETYMLQEGFVWLRWAVAEKLGEGSHVVKRRNDASWRRSVIVSLKEAPNCVQGRGGRIRSGSDRVIDKPVLCTPHAFLILPALAGGEGVATCVHM